MHYHIYTANELELTKNAKSEKEKQHAQENLDLLTPIVKSAHRSRCLDSFYWSPSTWRYGVY